MSDLGDFVRPMVKDAMHEGGKLALDSAVRLVGRLVQTFTVQGKPHEAMGAAAAMEMLKELRAHTPSLYEANERDAAGETRK
jgi:hypothetical protein